MTKLSALECNVNKNMKKVKYNITVEYWPCQDKLLPINNEQIPSHLFTVYHAVPLQKVPYFSVKYLGDGH